MSSLRRLTSLRCFLSIPVPLLLLPAAARNGRGMKVLRESTWDAAAAQRRAQRARRRRQAATWKGRRGMPGPPRFLDRCDTLHDGRPKILRPQEASGGSGASPAKSGQIQWKNSPPARPSDQSTIAEPNGRGAAGELLAVSLLIRTDFFFSSVAKKKDFFLSSLFVRLVLLLS